MQDACCFKFVGKATGDTTGKMWCCLGCGNVVIGWSSNGPYTPFKRACSGIFGKQLIEAREQLDAIHAILAHHYCEDGT